MNFIDDIKELGLFRVIDRNFIYKIRNLYDKISRMIFWGWHMRDNYDWDFNYTYHILYLKLSRIEKCIIDNGHFLWQDNSKSRRCKSLKEAKEIARRLYFDDTIRYFTKQFHEEYGYNRVGGDVFDQLFGSGEIKTTTLSQKTYR